MSKKYVETAAGASEFTAPARKRKKKKKIGCAVSAGVILVLLAAAVLLPRFFFPRDNKPAVYSGDVCTVTRRNVFDTVSATGLVVSDKDSTARVYSTLSYKIETVAVEVGDRVKKDDVLARYETESLTRSIKEREIASRSGKKSSALSVSNAKLTYDTFAAGVEDGTNASLVSANSALASAQENYDSAKKDYDTYLEKLDASIVVELNQAKRNLDNAQKDYDELAAEIENGTNTKLRDAKTAAEDAKKDYEDYKTLVDNNETSSLFSAHTQVINAKEAYNDAYNDLQDADDDLYDARHTENGPVAAAEAAYNAAVNAKRAAERSYRNAEENYEFAKENEARNLEKYKTAWDKAETAYADVLQSLKDTLESYANALTNAEEAYMNAAENVDTKTDGYAKALRTAERNLNDSQINLENTKISVNNQLESYRVSYENALLNADTTLADYQLSNLYKDLEKATVKAPIGGTVTAVYAVEGETASGVMFVIEDTENLVVNASVKAYDLDSVFEGMNVFIKTDSTGDREYHGILESIAPTAQKGTGGTVVSTSDAAFDTVIRVTDADARLRIGLSARISYLLAGSENALALPSTAVLSDGEGAFALSIAQVQEENETAGTAAIVRIPLTVGASDGVYTEILTGLSEGDVVIDNAENYRALIGEVFAYSDIDSSVSDEDPFAKMMSGGTVGGAPHR